MTKVTEQTIPTVIGYTLEMDPETFNALRKMIGKSTTTICTEILGLTEAQDRLITSLVQDLSRVLGPRKEDQL